MKRIEAIETITKRLDKLLLSLGFKVNDLDLISDNILSDLEELGMAPPEIEGVIEEGRFNKRRWEEPFLSVEDVREALENIEKDL